MIIVFVLGSAVGLMLAAAFDAWLIRTAKRSDSCVLRCGDEFRDAVVIWRAGQPFAKYSDDWFIKLHRNGTTSKEGYGWEWAKTSGRLEIWRREK